MRQGCCSTAFKVVWGAVVVLAVLHYDFWYWDDTSVIFGFLPVGLAYQAGISIAASIAWALVMWNDWPDEVEEWASEPADSE